MAPATSTSTAVRPGAGSSSSTQVTEGLTTPHRNAVRGAGGALRLSASCPIGISNYCGVSYTITVPPGVTVTADSEPATSTRVA